MLKLPANKLVSLLTAATLTAVMVTAPTALGLGLGSPAVESHIGEPLRVRIPVSIASESELEALQVRIAGAEWYARAGIERDPVVDLLLVGIERTRDGANLLITSADGLNQIMLPLLLEVTGSGMTLRKQVSVLLSPDLSTQPDDPWQDPRVEVSGVIGADAARITAPAAPAVSDSASAWLPLNSQPGTPARQMPAAEAAADPGPEVAWPPTVRVRPGDSLSTIVNDLLPAGATRFQGRMAFYDRNPEAFEQGDIHRLKADVVMVVPSPDDILALPRGESWTRYQLLTTPAPMAEPEPSTETPAPEFAVADASESTGTVAALAVTPADAAEPRDGAGYRLSLHDAPMELLPDSLQSSEDPIREASPLTDRPDAGGAADESLLLAEADQLPRIQGFSLRMDALNAYVIELQDENRFLKQRVASLEGNVNRLNDELASLNARLVTVETGAGGATTIGFDAPAVDRDTGLIGSVDDVLSEDNVDAVADMEESAAPASLPRSAEVAEEPVLEETPSASAATVVSNPSGVSRVVMGEDLVTVGRRYLEIATQPVVRLIGGVVVLALLLLIWMMRFSRRERELTEERGQQQSFDQLDLDRSKGVSFSADPENAIDPDEADGLMVQPGLFPDTDTLQDSDVDLITQAEVYLKYHRPSQAVQALREEYGKPDSDKFVVAMRLIEVFREMGGTEERNKALGTFISRMNEDIELFTDEQWMKLREALDDMRRDEQDSALRMDRKPGESAEVLEPDIEAWERLGKL